MKGRGRSNCLSGKHYFKWLLQNVCFELVINQGAALPKYWLAIVVRQGRTLHQFLRAETKGYKYSALLDGQLSNA